MIKVEHVSMSYGRRVVLKDISFEIREGKTVGLLGANGAGKSTTMNILTGYLRPESGTVLINERDIIKESKEAKKKIGYLPEVPALYKEMRIREYLLFAAELKGVRDKGVEVNRVIELFQLKEREYDFIKKLSKGLQQRVGFACALLGNPEVLILDEPLSGLDPAEAKRTREIIRELKENHIIMISSHVLSEIDELCNEILMLKDGQLVLNNSTANVKRGKRQKTYRLNVKGERQKIEECLKQYELIREITYIGEKETGVHEFLLQSKNTRDIRDSILGYLVGRKFNVYGIAKEETSLEDVFLEMNVKEDM